MKYIIFKQLNEEFPVLFPSIIKHSDMAEALLKEEVLVPMYLVSAGFIRGRTYDEQGIVCYGDSMTLNLPSRPQDTSIVNKFLGLESWME